MQQQEQRVAAVTFQSRSWSSVALHCWGPRFSGDQVEERSKGGVRNVLLLFRCCRCWMMGRPPLHLGCKPRSPLSSSCPMSSAP